MEEWSESERRSLESLRQLPLVRATVEVLRDRRYEFSPDDVREAERVLVACCGVLLGEERLHPGTIKRYLTGFSNGYGCWLGSIEEAIGRAEIENEEERALLKGALAMAKAFLFDIEGHNRRRV